MGAGLAQVLGAMTQEIRSTMAGNLSLGLAQMSLGEVAEILSCLQGANLSFEKCIRLAQYIKWLT